MDKKSTIIIAAAVVIVAVAAIAFVMLGDSDEKKDYSETSIGEIGTYVPIFGNATGDLYIDEDDVDMLQSIVNGDIEWGEKKAPFADADRDGKITQNDVDLVKKIIAVEPCTVYYQDYFGEDTAVNFPLTNRNIAVTYYQQAEACAILGVLDKVNVASRAATVYEDLWPSLKDAVPWGTTGSSAITDDAVEKFIDNDVSLVICTPRVENKELAQRLHAERGIDFIQLWYNGNYCISTIQTMGILMDCQDRSEKYMNYCNGVIKDLESKITDTTSKKILVVNGYNASKDSLTIMANERHGSYALINKYLGKAYTEDGTNQFGFVYHNVEWMIENSQKFDSIVYCMSGNSGFSTNQDTKTYYTHEEYNEAFETAVSYFSKVKAYEDGNIIGSVYANTFGFSAYAFLKLIAAQLYPDLFSLEDGIEEVQYWFDNFNTTKIDVTKVGAYSYTGDGYKTSYPKMEA